MLVFILYSKLVFYVLFNKNFYENWLKMDDNFVICRCPNDWRQNAPFVLYKRQPFPYSIALLSRSI